MGWDARLLGFAHNAQPEAWLLVEKSQEKKCVGYFDQAVCL
jgi:hypothetical protein